MLDRRLPMVECQTFGENFDEKLEVIEFGGKSGDADGGRGSGRLLKIFLHVEGKSRFK